MSPEGSVVSILELSRFKDLEYDDDIVIVDLVQNPAWMEAYLSTIT